MTTLGNQPTGIFTISAEAYHADEGDQPSLSSSIASILCSQSPRHAWTAHPRLNPGYERTEDAKFDLGKACHAVFLEGRDNVFVVHEDDWRKKEAKEARDYARSVGKVPLLAKHRDVVYAMDQAVREQLADHHAQPPLFKEGKSEQTLLWEEDGVLCKARLDWLRADHATIDDLKTTSRSANPEAYSRALFGVGGDVQAAFHLRGLRSLTGAEATFRWCVVENSPPYALSVVSPGPDILALGEAKVERALALWRKCLESGEWPGYTPQVAYAQMPPWEEARFMEKEEVAA